MIKLDALQLRRADRLALIWAVVAASLVSFFGAYHAFDDPFITYRYAANLAAGEGLVYNPGERVLSTTAPLYAIILAPAALLGLPLPLFSNLLGALSLGAGAVALWQLGRAAAQPVAGAVAALLFPFTPLLLTTLGGETVIWIVLVLWAFRAAQAEQVVAAGILLGLASLVRADAALAAAMLGPLILMRRGLLPALRFAIAFGLSLAPFVLAGWIYYGSPLPATLGAKRSQAHIPGSRSYFNGLRAYLGGLLAQPWAWPVGMLAPLGLLQALRQRDYLALIVLWGSAHMLAYSLLGVTAYFWYFGPALTGLSVATALGAQLLADGLGQRPGRSLRLGIVAALVLMIMVGQLSFLGTLRQGIDRREPVYRAAGLWLREHTPPEARVGALEVGIIGYYAERPMVDFAGLIQPELAAVFNAGGDYREAARQAIAHYRPAYLVNQEQIFPLVSSDPALAAVCSEVVGLPDVRFAQPLQIFHCIWEP